MRLAALSLLLGASACEWVLGIEVTRAAHGGPAASGGAMTDSGGSGHGGAGRGGAGGESNGGGPAGAMSGAGGEGGEGGEAGSPGSGASTSSGGVTNGGGPSSGGSRAGGATTGGTGGMMTGGAGSGAAAGMGGSTCTVDDCVDRSFAVWPMPNPPNTASGPALDGGAAPLLPYPQDYDTASKPGVVIDRVTRLEWERDIPADTLVFSDAEEHCRTLGVAGDDDWRVPTRIELMSILDIGRSDPAIDGSAFGELPSNGFLTQNYWTRSAVREASPQRFAWVVDFAGGGQDYYAESSSGAWVRCVRGGAIPAMPHYRIGSRGSVQTVTDLGTGLVWQQGVASTELPGLTWDAAEAYCASLGSGWRLPSVKELDTLVDDSAWDPAIDSAFVGNDGFWSSSRLASNPALVWVVNFASGKGVISGTNAASMNEARCVVTP